MIRKESSTNKAGLSSRVWLQNQKWVLNCGPSDYGVYMSTETKKSIPAKIWPLLPTWVGLFMFTKEFRNYTKENMPVQYFGSSLLMNGLIFARSSLDCHIFSALSVDTHIGYTKSHKAIWLYGFMAIIWLYGWIAIWLYGSFSSRYGCLRKEY